MVSSLMLPTSYILVSPNDIVSTVKNSKGASQTAMAIVKVGFLHSSE